MRPQALGLSLHGSASIALEIGSRFFVDCSQNKNDPSGRFYFGSEGIELPNDFCFSKRFGGFGVANETKESTEGIFFRK